MIGEVLWSELHDLFDTDDGSLPEVRVDFTRRDGVTLGYALLRSRAGSLVGKASFWSKTRNEECLLDSVSNAAALVTSGEAEAFHVVLGGIQSRGVTIPDLGVFVFEDQLALDYRMGAPWGPGELHALFELLADLTRLDPGASLSLEPGMFLDVVARFQNAWQRWNADQAR
jgi:hypothetical protein